MPNFTNAFKSEISRIARKELKAEILALRKTAATQRTEIGALKKALKEVQSSVFKLGKHRIVTTPASRAAKSTTLKHTGRLPNVPFGPARFAEFRAQMGLTQAQMATLVQASQLSIYKWETGKVVPRMAQLERITEVLCLGKREVQIRLISATSSAKDAV